MSDLNTQVYEGMFLFSQAAAGNLQGALDHVTELLKRADAEIISLGKWDERRLAFEIKGNKRGVYFLAYFHVDPSRLAGLERDCNLSEQLLRTMVTRAEYHTDEVMQSAEGRERLADEIKLRGEQKATTAASTSRVESATAVAEPPVAVEAPTEDAPAEATEDKPAE